MPQANKPQAQDSLYAQMKRLIPIANREGLYDAADHLQRDVDRIEKNLKWLDNIRNENET